MSFVADLVSLIGCSTDGRLACPSHWARVPLGTVAKIVNGFPFPSSGFGATGIPVIRIRDVAAGITDTRFSGPVPEGFWVEPGDLIIGMDGDFTAALWQTDRALLNQRVCRLLPDTERLDLQFLHYVLPAYLELINENTPSVTVKHLSSRTLALIPIPLPGLDIQKEVARRINDLFVEVDDGEAALARARSDLATWRKALLKAAVTGELTADWRSANPQTETGAELLARILADRRARWLAEPRNKGRYIEPTKPDITTLPALPADWVWASLESLLVGGIQNGLYMPQSVYGMGAPILRIDDFQAAKARSSAALRQVAVSSEIENIYSLDEGDCVINRVNSLSHLGKSFIVRKQHLPALFESNMMRAKPSKLMVLDYLETYLASDIGRSRLCRNAKAAVNQASINQTDVSLTPVPVPPTCEQAMIVEMVSHHLNPASADEIVGLETTAATLRQSILAAAFRGKLVA